MAEKQTAICNLPYEPCGSKVRTRSIEMDVSVDDRSPSAMSSNSTCRFGAPASTDCNRFTQKSIRFNTTRHKKARSVTYNVHSDSQIRQSSSNRIHSIHNCMLSKDNCLSRSRCFGAKQQHFPCATNKQFNPTTTTPMKSDLCKLHGPVFTQLHNGDELLPRVRSGQVWEEELVNSPVSSTRQTD
jgi:hypothetical protein